MTNDTNIISDAERALSDMGIKLEDLDGAFQLLQARKEAQDSIERETTNKFYDNAVTLCGIVRHYSKEDGFMAVSGYLRRFMEYGVVYTLQAAGSGLVMEDIVNAMPQMAD
jgi:hypothetical protein